MIPYMPEHLMNHCMVMLNETTVIGGKSDDTVSSQDTYILHTETGAWTKDLLSMLEELLKAVRAFK